MATVQKKSAKKKAPAAAGVPARPPVVVVVGHIDHGKTTLLDYIRKTRVVEKEAGSITQHIGAYQAKSGEHTITFLDTPGHEAFVGVRTRGLQVADIAVLVIAADEGVKEQTKEAIALIQASKLPFVVAFNKIDKPEANVQLVKKQLSEARVAIEEWGGDVPAVELSAKTGQGVPELLEMITLLGELAGLAANAAKPAEGVVMDARLDTKRGAVAGLLVRDGTLQAGDYIATQGTYGRIRNMEDFLGQRVSEAGPSTPVQIVGLKALAKAGRRFQAAKTLAEAKKLCEVMAAESQAVTIKGGITPERTTEETVYLVLKADQQGSLEAILHALKQLPSEKSQCFVVNSGLGSITANDVELAVPKRALVFGFQVAALPEAENVAQQHGIKVRTFKVIYELIDTVKAALEGKLKPVVVRTEVARLKVAAIFRREKNRMIVGGRVQDGKLRRGLKFEIVRDDTVVGEGKVMQLKQGKDEATSVGKDRDCGVLFEGDTVVEEGDILRQYEEHEEIPNI